MRRYSGRGWIRLRGVHRLRRLARRAHRYIRHPFSSPALVLMYHRVAALASDPQLLGVSPPHFAEHLEVLRKSTRPISLADMAERVRHGQLEPRNVVVTFDDGYADNLVNARPVLERFDVPATVFVTAGYIGTEREFWWDELERLLLQPGTLPSELRLTARNDVHRWMLNGTAFYDEASFERNRAWHIECAGDPTQRHVVYRSVYRLLHDMAPDEREPVIEILQRWSGLPRCCRASHRTLSVAELHALADGGLIEIGAHSMTHPVLSTLPVACQQWEIEKSKSWLEQVLERPVVSFAYPHGAASADTVAIVARAGFQVACSTRPEPVWPAAEGLQLPRFGVRDWDGDTFERQIRSWLAG